jgi:hypothetical protein
MSAFHPKRTLAADAHPLCLSSSALGEANCGNAPPLLHARENWCGKSGRKSTRARRGDKRRAAPRVRNPMFAFGAFRKSELRQLSAHSGYCGLHRAAPSADVRSAQKLTSPRMLNRHRRRTVLCCFGSRSRSWQVSSRCAPGLQIQSPAPLVRSGAHAGSRPASGSFGGRLLRRGLGS